MTTGQVRNSAISRMEPVLADFVPFSTQITDRIVKNGDGALLISWRVDGLAFETSDPEDLNIRHKAFNQMLRGLPYGSAIWTHRVRRQTTASLTADYEEEFARKTAARYYDGFEGYQMMVNELYMTYVYRPSHTFAKKPGRGAATNIEEVRVRERKAIEEVMQVAGLIEASLKPYDLAPLGCFEQNGTTFSDQLSFYGFLLNGEWKKVAVRGMQIRNYLPTSRLFFGGERIEIRTAESNKYAGVLDLQDYPQSSEAGSLDVLLYEPYEYIETQSFTLMAKPEAKSTMELQIRHLQSTEDVSASQIGALHDALDELVNGTFCYGSYHYSLVVFGGSPDAVSSNLAKARAALNEEGFQAALVDLVPDGAWFAQMPGNWRYRTRSANLTSLNFAGLSAFHNFSVGKRDRNPWGEAVTILKTPNDSPFYFNWHNTPVNEDSFDKKAPGNTIIIGMTGSGKTVLELFLVTMSLKYHPTIVFFDKDRGGEIAIRALGGNYRCLKRNAPTGFNPFQLPPTPSNLRFQDQLLTSLIPRALTPVEQADLSRAINQTSRFDKEHRTLSVVRQQLHDVSPDGVRAHLAKWCADEAGHLAWVFDNPTDTVDLTQGRLFGFDDTDLLNDPEVLGPVTMYLLHLAESLLDGRRFMYVMAEFWKRLELPAFADFAVNKQYTIRKQNGFGIFDTQSPAQILKTPHVAAMVEQCATQIFLPNPKADAKEYIEGFKVTRAEFDAIRGFGESSRQFLVKQGQKSVINRLDLSGLGPELLDILSTSLDNVELLDQIRAEVGDAPADWLPIFQERIKERRSV